MLTILPPGGQFLLSEVFPTFFIFNHEITPGRNYICRLPHQKPKPSSRLPAARLNSGKPNMDAINFSCALKIPGTPNIY